MHTHVVDTWWSDLRAMDLDLLPLLDPLEASRAAGIARPADLGRFVVGAWLLRVAVGAATGADPRAVVVDRTCTDCGGPHGRPIVDGVHASVAHAGPLVLVATAPVPVGVDVESGSRGGDIAAWVVQEATFKATGARSPDGVRVVGLQAPLPGYHAALAVGGEAVTGDAVDVRAHGPEESALAQRRAR
ncbi:4'-phosphopantetheinyl transferase family protein [Janibacter terrae]|uniref:4'-phosphopantetheinyl transferase family protein n=1 Tax=Janibacter terrae TaxID=103817 RepID=UPI00082D085A|nr:hypothetical protein [Janibacter terrae]